MFAHSFVLVNILLTQRWNILILQKVTQPVEPEPGRRKCEKAIKVAMKLQHCGELTQRGPLWLTAQPRALSVQLSFQNCRTMTPFSQRHHGCWCRTFFPSSDRTQSCLMLSSFQKSNQKENHSRGQVKLECFNWLLQSELPCGKWMIWVHIPDRKKDTKP